MGSSTPHPLLKEHSHVLRPLALSLGKPGLGIPPPLTEEEGAKHVRSGDDKAKDATGATLDQMDPGILSEELVWAQSARYFLRTYSMSLYTWGGPGGSEVCRDGWPETQLSPVAQPLVMLSSGVPAAHLPQNMSPSY